MNVILSMWNSAVAFDSIALKGSFGNPSDARERETVWQKEGEKKELFNRDNRIPYG